MPKGSYAINDPWAERRRRIGANVACLGCGKIFAITNRNRQAKFCNAACFAETQSRRYRVDVSTFLAERQGSEGCWEWPGERKKKDGYAKTIRDGETLLAHRVVWETLNEPIPPNAEICHTCDNPPCCNPSHLWLGDALANAADKVAKGRQHRPRGETNGVAKLIAEQVLIIRRSAEPDSILSARYGVSTTAIRDVRSRRRWGWLEEPGAADG